jgi:two-component system sensor histidine kinase KdpD
MGKPDVSRPLSHRESAGSQPRAKSVGRVSRVMRELLDVMGLEAGTLPIERRSHRIAPLVGEAIERLSHRAGEKRITLDGLVHDTPEVQCDARRIVDVIAQLIANGIEASPHGGTIAVRADARDGAVVLSIADRGPGIDVRAWPYIFDGPWQDASAREGLDEERRAKAPGVGLALCRASVRAHGGDIWVESRLGEGTTVFFSLPVA